LRRFRIQATQAAGSPALRLASSENAIEVMTGAILPLGSDCVIPVEQIDVAEGFANLKVNAHIGALRNVHRRGSDGRQGALLLESGTLLRAPEIAVAASAGMARVRVIEPAGRHGDLHRR
jgi:molybdopterin molybdotransferase